MNVTELARQLKTTRDELLEKLPALGFDIGARAIKIDPRLAERIKEAWTQSARRERLRVKLSAERAKEVEPRGEDAGAKAEIALPGKIAVGDLAERLGIDVARLVGYLMKNGIMASLSQPVDFETASVVAEDHGFRAVRGEEGDSKETEQRREAIRDLKAGGEKAGLVPRPPVVVVMGHVDHGKTTLLDAIRNTDVALGETGGITQHIGAYQVEEKGRHITFLDTPGHEAFRAMRERGGQVADVAILVVAADDGLKPQTFESIRVIQKEGLPFVVAINKVDLPGADIDRVKKELAEINLQPEDWGGSVICVPVSAKKGENIHELLEMVLLVADLENFQANPDEPAQGVIIESHIDRGEGPVATVLVNVGTLRVGDEVVIGSAYGKMKFLKNWRGESAREAGPGTPVKILGLKSAPRVGDILRVEKIGRAVRKKGAKKHRLIDIEATDSKLSEEGEESAARVKFPVIIRADVLGSLEAILTSLKKLETRDVAIDVLRQSLGNITEGDISLAEDSGAVVYGFSVDMSVEARKASVRARAAVLTRSIIYEILDDAKARIEKLAPKKTVRVEQGDLRVLKIFKDSRAGSIIGGRVEKAKIAKGARFHLLRGGEAIEEGVIEELQRNKEAVDEVREGDECGIRAVGARGFEVNDVLACFSEEEK